MWRRIQKKPAVVRSSNHSKAKEQKGSGEQPHQHVAGVNVAMGLGFWQPIHSAPALGAHVEEASEPSRQEAIVTGGQTAQGRQPAVEPILGALLEGQHLTSKGSQGAWGPNRSQLSHPEAELGEAVLHGFPAVLTQASVHRLLTESESGPGTSASKHRRRQRSSWLSQPCHRHRSTPSAR